jgi:23S rRNA (cytidine1920-2'-O)/16S rRNA (cytidine1409-2'-O)-methyltransferase
MPKIRLDQHLPALGLVPSREQARRLIMAGEVTVNGQVVDKPATPVAADAVVALKAKPRFVSRGGEKLEAALAQFGLDVQGQVCADVGASTGGFTDCLLQRGAARVYAIDVGHGILDYRLRTEARVVVLEDTNARYLAQLPEPAQFVAVDAAFISLKLLLPVVQKWLPAPPGGDVVALIKPQFEAGRQVVAKGAGVVKDPAVHRQVLQTVLGFAEAGGWAVKGLLISPLRGPKGNVEFLTWLGQAGPSVDWAAWVSQVS